MTESLDFVYKITMNAIVTTPTGFDPKKERLPMIFFLHGAGEVGEDLELVKKNGIPKLFSADPDYGERRVITVSPQCPPNFGWRNLTKPLYEFVNKMAEKYNADPDRISLTGLSMGGYGTFALAAEYPDYFSCIAPICGGGDLSKADRYKMPVWAHHGDLDTVVPLDRSKYMVDAINKAGGNARLTVYENCGHGSWEPAYEGSSDLIDFLVNTKRNGK